jgi:hypothetical protein
MATMQTMVTTVQTRRFVHGLPWSQVPWSVFQHQAFTATARNGHQDVDRGSASRHGRRTGDAADTARSGVDTNEHTERPAAPKHAPSPS